MLHSCFPTRLRQRAGYTLTEVAIVLAVIGVILAGVWTAAGVVNEKTRLSQAVDQANIIAQNMTAFLQSGYGVTNAPVNKTDITGIMITSGVIPPWAQTPPGGGTTGQNPWDQAGFHIWWVSASPREYRMSFYNIGSERGCIGLLAGLTSCTPGQPGCPVRVLTGGKSNNFTGGGTPTTTQLSTTAMQGLCDPSVNNYSSNGNGNNNSVEFDFLN